MRADSAGLLTARIRQHNLDQSVANRGSPPGASYILHVESVILMSRACVG
jgi:hypothetical protein